MAATKFTFKQFIEKKFGKFSYFLVYAVLEWTLMAILFVDGLISFAANEFARFFELQIPCLLCTRIDHVLVCRNPDFYYNDSICDLHKKEVSSKAYCHVHRRLSDIQRMCEGCLLSFATEKKPSCDPYKPLVGILGSDVESSAEENHKAHMRFPAHSEEDSWLSNHRCSCCGEPLRGKTQSLAMNGGNVPHAPTSTPRVATVKNEELRGVDPLTHVRDTDSEISKVEYGSRTDNQCCREDSKAPTVPLLTENVDLNEDSCKTPNFIRTNRFSGIMLTDSPTASPRWLHRLHKTRFSEKTDMGSESLEGQLANNADGDTILHHLKRQVRLDRKSLIDLYMELDEERSASAVAANQAMAMITRLQAEKAAIQMEALQYQRLIEEQVEYDQEALQVMKDLLIKREEENRILEVELEEYRQRFEYEEEENSDDGYRELKHQSISSVSESCKLNLDEDTKNDGELERSYDKMGASRVENGSLH